MNVDRYMVNLFFEIKRNLPLNTQKNLKISANDLGDTMAALYKESDDENIKVLIEVFMERAGAEWFKMLKKKKTLLPSFIANKTKTEQPKDTKKGKTKMIYRGQEVLS